MWVIQHTGNAASIGPLNNNNTNGAAARGGNRSNTNEPKVPSPFPKLPALKSAPTWQRKGLLLQKLRQCSIIFESVDSNRYADDWEIKRNTLLEVVDYADAAGRQLFSDFRVLEDTFIMIKLNLFRSLPKAPEPSGDPDEEEEIFSDPQWPHLNIIYELLLRLVSLDQIDLSLRKKVIDANFVKQLLILFDSEDAKERDYLKTITHRIYSKLTQRRALIRRVICNVFYEFILETENHHGIAEMLEILASIINGFAVPIKDEHKIMLIKALIPLHKAKNIAEYHPQLSYCMALYVAKDHTLTRDIIPGLLKYWPFSSSTKQIMFLNELDDIFEYVQEDDVASFLDQLALRLAKCIGGLHFQVSERTLLLWNSERFSTLLFESSRYRAQMFRIIFPILYDNQQGHWHENIRTLSGQILDQYKNIDKDLYFQLKDDYDAALAAQTAAANTVASSLGSSMVGNTTTDKSLNGLGSPAPVRSPLQSNGISSPLTSNITNSLLNSPNTQSNANVASTPGSSLRSSVSTPSPTQPGHTEKSPMSSLAAHLHGPRAPVVRASSSFAVSDNADLLPTHHRDNINTITPKRGHGNTGMTLPMPIPSVLGSEAAEGTADD